MDAHEALAVLGLELLEAVLDQVLAVHVVDHDVLLLGLQVAHVLDGDAPQAAAQARAQVAARAVAGGARPRRGRRHQLARLGQRGLEALAPDRLEHVVGGGGVEGAQRVLVVGGAEDDGGRGLERADRARRAQAVEAGHRDVEQHHVGAQPADHLDGLVAVRRRADALDAVELGQQRGQALARQRLVIGNEHLHRGHPRLGSGFGSCNV